MIEQQATEVQEVTTVSTPTAQQVVRKVKVVTPPIGSESPHKVYQTKKVIFRTYQIVWYILGVIEVLLAFRILLKLLGANPYSGFTDFVYTVSSPFASPFLGVLGVTASSDIVLEWSTFIAMVVYAIVAYGIVSLLQLIKPTNPQEVEQTVDSQ